MVAQSIVAVFLALSVPAYASDPAPAVRWVDRNTQTTAAPPVSPLRIDLGGRAVPMDDPPQLHTAAPIHIDVVDADIRSVLRLFSSTTKLNFVVPDTVQSTVTAQLNNVPWDLALAAILSAEGLQAVSFSDDVIVIESLDRR